MIKKIDNLTFITFHSANLLLILLYLYPGSILGYLLYGNFSSQPQITKDFIISSNHFYAFFLLSMLGIFAYRKSKKINNLMIYLIFISFTLEIMHLVIPERSYQFNDLFGNLLGSLAIIIIYKLWSKNENK
jgi:VanZ family protein